MASSTKSNVANAVVGPEQLDCAVTSAAQVEPGPHRSRLYWLRRAVQTVLAVEAAGLALALAAGIISRRGEIEESSGSGSDLDPADVLMDYLTGRAGLAALKLLRNDQLQAAADTLVTEDFEELGVSDRGAEIKRTVASIIEVRAALKVHKGAPSAAGW